MSAHTTGKFHGFRHTSSRGSLPPVAIHDYNFHPRTIYGWKSSTPAGNASIPGRSPGSIISDRTPQLTSLFSKTGRAAATNSISGAAPIRAGFNNFNSSGGRFVHTGSGPNSFGYSPSTSVNVKTTPSIGNPGPSFTYPHSASITRNALDNVGSVHGGLATQTGSSSVQPNLLSNIRGLGKQAWTEGGVNVDAASLKTASSGGSASSITSTTPLFAPGRQLPSTGFPQKKLFSRPFTTGAFGSGTRGMLSNGAAQFARAGLGWLSSSSSLTRGQQYLRDLNSSGVFDSHANKQLLDGGFGGNRFPTLPPPSEAPIAPSLPRSKVPFVPSSSPPLGSQRFSLTAASGSTNSTLNSSLSKFRGISSAANLSSPRSALMRIHPTPALTYLSDHSSLASGSLGGSMSRVGSVTTNPTRPFSFPFPPFRSAFGDNISSQNAGSLSALATGSPGSAGGSLISQGSGSEFARSSGVNASPSLPSVPTSALSGSTPNTTSSALTGSIPSVYNPVDQGNSVHFRRGLRTLSRPRSMLARGNVLIPPSIRPVSAPSRLAGSFPRDAAGLASSTSRLGGSVLGKMASTLQSLPSGIGPMVAMEIASHAASAAEGAWANKKRQVLLDQANADERIPYGSHVARFAKERIGGNINTLGSVAPWSFGFIPGLASHLATNTDYKTFRTENPTAGSILRNSSGYIDPQDFSMR